VLRPRITIKRHTNKYEHDLGKEKSNFRVFSDLAYFLPISIVISCFIIIMAVIGIPGTINYLKDSLGGLIPALNNQLHGVAPKEVNFSDVQTDSKYFDSIAFLKNKGILKGYGDGTIRPGNNISRAELVETVVKSKNQFPLNINYHGCFRDVGAEWYATSVCFAKEKGWVKGNDGLFYPGDDLTRGEALKIMLEAYEISDNGEVSVIEFQDVTEDDWYYSYVQAALKNSLLGENPVLDFFRPNEKITRAEAFQILYRIMLR
jgi:hypothetical protein